MNPTRSLLFSLCAATACSDDSITHVAPVVEDANAAIVVIFTEGIEVHGVDLAQSVTKIPATVDLDLAAEAYVLHYSCTLEKLGLTPGPLALGEGRRLPTSDDVHRLDRLGEEDARWSPMSEAPETILNLRLSETFPIPSNCALFDVEGFEFRLDNRDFSVPTVVTFDGAALMMTTDLRQLLFTPDGTLTEVATSTIHFTASLPADDGDVYLFGDRAMVKGRPDRGYVNLTPPTSGPVYVAERSPKGEPFEIYVVTSSGAIEQFDGSRWTTIRPPVGRNHRTTMRHGGTWRGPGNVLLLNSEVDVAPFSVTSIENGTVRSLSIEDEPLSISHHRSSTLVGTERGNLYELDRDHFQQVAGWEFVRPIDAIIPLENGFLITGWAGATQQWLPDQEKFCATETPPAFSTMLVQTDDRTIIRIGSLPSPTFTRLDLVVFRLLDGPRHRCP